MDSQDDVLRLTRDALKAKQKCRSEYTFDDYFEAR